MVDKNLIKELKDWGCDIDGALERMLNDTAFFIECVKAVNNDESFENLDKALKDGNISAAFDAAHNIKGVSGNVGLMPIQKAAEKIVEPLRIGKIDGLQNYCLELNSKNDELSSILKKYI